MLACPPSETAQPQKRCGQNRLPPPPADIIRWLHPLLTSPATSPPRHLPPYSRWRHSPFKQKISAKTIFCQIKGKNDIFSIVCCTLCSGHNKRPSLLQFLIKKATSMSSRPFKLQHAVFLCKQRYLSQRSPTIGYQCINYRGFLANIHRTQHTSHREIHSCTVTLQKREISRLNTRQRWAGVRSTLKCISSCIKEFRSTIKMSE